ncbi:MAG: hypothetical protein QOH79_603 [Acidimicrobiaceae bacterium]
MLETHHHTKTVQEFVDLYAKRRLNLSPAFQRQSVWSRADRQLLVKSLLEGVPIPSIYLYEQIGPGGVPKFDVIDGKQRLETILLFMRKGPLVKHEEELWVRTVFADDEELDWWNWQYLSRAMKNQFRTTKIATIEVEGDLSEIIDLFVRINSTGKRLTGQEKRSARYYASPVLRVAQRMADAQRPYLVKHNVVNPSQAQRMKHVELVTELLLAINAGQPLNKKTKIDEVIQGAALGAADLHHASVKLRQTFAYVASVLPDLKTTRFHNSVDFYSLALLLHRYREEGKAVSAHDSKRNALAGALLRDFGRGVDEVNDQIRTGKGVLTHQEPFREYLLTVRSDTDSFKQRMTRERLLREVLDNVFEDLDSTRLFNATQRRIVWHASTSKKCSFCGDVIRRWEEMAVDHVKPHSRGGKTLLTNAAIAHKRCNAAAGAKRSRR